MNGGINAIVCQIFLEPLRTIGFASALMRRFDFNFQTRVFLRPLFLTDLAPF